MTFSWVVDMLKRKGKTDAEIDAELVENYGWRNSTTPHIDTLPQYVSETITTRSVICRKHNKGWYENARRRARERAND